MSRNENHGQMNSRKNDLKHYDGESDELYFTLHLTTKTHTTHVSPHHTDTATSTPNPTYLHPTHVHEATCSESIRVWASPASPPSTPSTPSHRQCSCSFSDPLPVHALLPFVDTWAFPHALVRPHLFLRPSPRAAEKGVHPRIRTKTMFLQIPSVWRGEGR